MRWSKEKAWEWYNSRPWFRGCNYMSADCANRVDQWQELGFEERFKTTEEELKLMQETGFNTVRLILEYVVWKEEHDGFMERFERYISLCAKYGMSCMIVLANDCMPPKTERAKSSNRAWAVASVAGDLSPLRLSAFLRSRRTGGASSASRLRSRAAKCPSPSQR